MANGINSLLALGSLQAPGMKKKKESESMFKPIDLQPINNNLEPNMGGFGQPLMQQPSLNIQAPSQLSASLQIDAIGGGPDQIGGAEGATTGGGYGDIDIDEGSGVSGLGGQGGQGGQTGSMFGGDEYTYTPFQTSRESLFESFYGGLQDPYRSQLVSATAQDSEGGQALSLEELADLAGFDTSKLSADDYQALQSAGIGQFANYMQGTGEKLENLQGYRSMLLSQAATEGSYAAEGLLGMAEEGSVSGLRSGRETTRGRQARKSLREAMQTQLLGGEESYQSELEGLRSEVVGGLREGVAGIADKVIGLNADLGTKLKDYNYEFGDANNPSNSYQYNPNAGNPAKYNQIYSLYDITPSDMQAIQTYLTEFFVNNNYYPTTGALDSYIQTLGYGQDEE